MDENAVQRLGRSVIRAGVSLPIVLLYALAPKPGSAELALSGVALVLRRPSASARSSACGPGACSPSARAGALMLTLAGRWRVAHATLMRCRRALAARCCSRRATPWRARRSLLRVVKRSVQATAAAFDRRAAARYRGGMGSSRCVARSPSCLALRVRRRRLPAALRRQAGAPAQPREEEEAARGRRGRRSRSSTSTTAAPSFSDDPKKRASAADGWRGRSSMPATPRSRAPTRPRMTSAKVGLIKEAIDKYRNALIKDRYNVDATLKLAVAYDKVLRKGCAIAMLKRLAAARRAIPSSRRGATASIDAIDENGSVVQGLPQGRDGRRWVADEERVLFARARARPRRAATRSRSSPRRRRRCARSAEPKPKPTVTAEGLRADRSAGRAQAAHVRRSARSPRASTPRRPGVRRAQHARNSGEVDRSHARAAC